MKQYIQLYKPRNYSARESNIYCKPAETVVCWHPANAVEQRTINAYGLRYRKIGKLWEIRELTLNNRTLLDVHRRRRLANTRC